MPLTASERQLRASFAANTSWARTEDRAARTRNGTQAFLDRFEREVDPNGTLLPEERAKRAENARKAYFQKLAFQSAKARRQRAERAQ